MKSRILRALKVMRPRGVWLVLLVLAVILAGSGFYLNTEPEWFKSYPEHYNRGVTEYLQDRLGEAYNQFGKVALEAEDQELKALSFFQMGTMLGKPVLEDKEGKMSIEQRYLLVGQAIKDLEQAVRNNPNNEEAKYNLEVLRKERAALSAVIAQGQGEKQEEPGSDYSPGGGDVGY